MKCILTRLCPLKRYEHRLTKHNKFPIILLAAILAVSLFSHSALAKRTTKDARILQGANLAGQYCAGCHAIAGEGESPLPEAPPFSTFSDKWPSKDLSHGMAKGIVAGHQTNPMPVFAFTSEEMEALSAYINGVRKKQAGQ